MKWISVKDRLPDEHYLNVLVMHSDLNDQWYPCLWQKCYGGFLYFSRMENRYLKLDVSHWLEIPPPPNRSSQ